ncbi:MAG: hypothetical protein RMK29_04160 [Myxococcales bacterium]|nr:hypothetical protein [Myxococcota bacterium]MDW8280881.1 hypothetical protein [Myxococcales bacterium]
MWWTPRPGRWLILSMLLGACPEPSVTFPSGPVQEPDLRQSQGPPLFRASGELPVLSAEVKLPAAERWREWKRDPEVVLGAAERQMYLAGSPAPPNGLEQWTIGRAVMRLDQPGGAASFQQLLTPRPGRWDGGDLLSPAVIPNYGGRGFALWYAASGDPQRPDYVFQIGLATSPDGQHWERREQPVLAAPPFSSNGPDGRPREQGPTSHGLLDPAVVPMGGSTIWMYFTGVSCEPRCRFQILRAVSSDGVHFQTPQVVWRGRPEVSQEEGGVAGPSVLVREGRFYLAYTQVHEPAEPSRDGIRRAIVSGSLGLAVSQDGVTFESASGPWPLLAPNRDFLRGGSFSPALVEEQGHLRLYFGALSNLDTPAFSIGRADLMQ